LGLHSVCFGFHHQTPGEEKNRPQGEFKKMKIEYTPIGIIHTPFSDIEGMPIQPAGAVGIKGAVEVYEKYRDGLKDLDGFSHIMLLYHLHKSEGFDLRVVPFLDTVMRGLFATRAPSRPNAIGVSVVRLMGIKDETLNVENVDMLNGTPLLDIKPHVPDFDVSADLRTGWLKDARRAVSKRKSDDRFR
jgi:tRNA-Thr(GGU) m(6)t(6)A37 methyltransferase TsaA